MQHLPLAPLPVLSLSMSHHSDTGDYVWRIPRNSKWVLTDPCFSVFITSISLISIYLTSPIILKIIILSLPLPTIFGGDWDIIITLKTFFNFLLKCLSGAEGQEVLINAPWQGTYVHRRNWRGMLYPVKTTGKTVPNDSIWKWARVQAICSAPREKHPNDQGWDFLFLYPNTR